MNQNNKRTEELPQKRDSRVNFDQYVCIYIHINFLLTWRPIKTIDVSAASYKQLNECEITHMAPDKGSTSK